MCSVHCMQSNENTIEGQCNNSITAFRRDEHRTRNCFSSCLVRVQCERNAYKFLFKTKTLHSNVFLNINKNSLTMRRLPQKFGPKQGFHTSCSRASLLWWLSFLTISIYFSELETSLAGFDSDCSWLPLTTLSFIIHSTSTVLL